MMNVLPWRRAERTDNATSALAPVTRLRWDVDRLFDRFFDDAWGFEAFESNPVRLDLFETDDEIRVVAEVPGIDPKDLDISLQGQVLTLSGEKRDEVEEKGTNRYYSERRFGTFRRSIQLPCPVEMDDVRAEHKNGVVTVTLKKSEAVRPKRIAVKSA